VTVHLIAGAPLWLGPALGGHETSPGLALDPPGETRLAQWSPDRLSLPEPI